MDAARRWFLIVLFTVCVMSLAGMPQLASAADEPAPPESASSTAEETGRMRGDGPGGLEPNCRAELKQLCGDVEPGGGRIKNCLKENEGKLSAGCRQQLQEKKERMKEKMKERRHELREACEADVKRLCPNVERGEGRIVNCLKDHKAELSEACGQSMEPRKRRK